MRLLLLEYKIILMALRYKTLFILLIFNIPDRVWADGLPRWEVGVGLAGLSVPFYRGAEEDKNYLVPLPYFIYRGERLKIDDAGIRGNIFRSERAKLDFSLAGGVPVPRDGNNARLGMPSLDPTIEVGPSLEIRMWRGHEINHDVWLRMPLRAAFALGRSMEHQGWIFAPYAEYAWRSAVRQASWKISVSAGPMFADQRYHDYFYEVAPAYATATRPEYHARGGYSGSRITLGLQRRSGDLWVGVFGRYDSLQGVAFGASPLVKSKEYHAIGVAMTWILFKSRTTVEDERSLLEAQARH